MSYYDAILERLATWSSLRARKRWERSPIIEFPTGSIDTYQNLAKIAHDNTYNVKSIDDYEIETGYVINDEWLENVGSKLQVVVKTSPLNYSHGRLLYAALRNYLKARANDATSITVLETGTARGFSALCMAKALSDSGSEGKICTFDILSNEAAIYWNCVSDHLNGKVSREALLTEWSALVERYILFIQGNSKLTLPLLSIRRVNFAFLDGAHSKEDVLFEFHCVAKKQLSGDIIVFDDYNIDDFPGLVEAVDYIGANCGYELRKFGNEHSARGYVLATKI